MTREGQRHPTDADIEAARNEALTRRRERASVLRSHANQLADWLEFETLDFADARNIADRACFVEYIIGLLSSRVLERRIAP